MINLNTPFKEFYDILCKGGACQESLDWLDPYIGKTMGAAIDALPIEDRESWSAWTLRKYCDILGAGARRHLMKNVDDPMQAFQLYTRMPSLSDADDAILESKFKGKLPRAERELADRLNTKVVRRKAVNNGRN